MKRTTFCRSWQKMVLKINEDNICVIKYQGCSLRAAFLVQGGYDFLYLILVIQYFSRIYVLFLCIREFKY